MTSKSAVYSVTVIIPVRRVNQYILDGLPSILQCSGALLEVIILPDVAPDEPVIGGQDRVRIIPTGPLGPAEKRDVGARNAKGEILAFLDDDAFPARNWLEASLQHFESDRVAAVGGPTLTPPQDSLLRQASGWALGSVLCSGSSRMRYHPIGAARPIDDWPSVNLLVRASDFNAVGGFNCQYYPGEDTKLCLEITRTLSKVIVYEPGAIVYHHRRPIFKEHLRQIWQYAGQRGFFTRVFPSTSRRLTYMLPSMLVAGMVTGGALSLAFPSLRRMYALFIGAYVSALILEAMTIAARTRQPVLGALSGLTIGMTHIWYGIGFVGGLLRRDLDR